MTDHKVAPIGEIHSPFQWTYADETEREAATGFTSADLYKIALQLDDGSVWVLTEDTPTWVQVGGGGGGGGTLVQRVYEEILTSTSNSATIPIDDSIPQSSEGSEIVTVAITPTNASNELYIEASVTGAPASAAWVIVALFKDSDANAIKAAWDYQSTGDGGVTIRVRHKMTAGTTSEITFKVRAGASGGNFRHNGNASSRLLGGVSACWISVEEIEP